MTQQNIRYRIWAEISGAVTGDRCGWVRNDGFPITRATLAEAEQEAAALSERMNGDPNHTASFRYTARPYRS